MTLDPAARTDIYRRARMVLVRHFIDLGRLILQVSMEGLRLRGSLVRLPGFETKLTPEIVTAIMQELRRVQGVRRIDADFDNWRQQDAMGGWVAVDKEPRQPGAPGSQGGAASKTFELGKGGGA